MIPILPETAWREFRGSGKAGQNLTRVHPLGVVDSRRCGVFVGR